MKTKIFNLLLAGLFLSGVALTGCSKSESINDLKNNAQKLAPKDPEDPHVGLGILNQNLGIIYALDGGRDITQQFTSYTFKFVGQEPSGEAQVWNTQSAQTGNWNMQPTGDFSISYPTNVFPEIVFLNRTWTMGESSSAVVRLIASDGDEVHFAAK